MNERKGNYEVGYGKPTVGSRFKNGQSGNPSRRRAKKTAAPLLVRKFSEQVVVAATGRCEKTTRNEVLMVQLVDQPASLGLSATKILTDVLRDIGKKASLSVAAGISGKPAPEATRQ